MRYLGLDLSLSRTAVVVLADGRGVDPWGVPQLEHVSTHFIETEPGDYPSSEARLHAMEDQLARLLFLAGHPDTDLRMTVVEGPSYASAFNNADVTDWNITARLLLFKSGYPFVQLAPARLKKFATGSGRGDKDGIRMEVLDRWHFKSANNDEADAYVCARYAHAMGDPRGLIKAQVECFKKPEPIVVRPMAERLRAVKEA